MQAETAIMISESIPFIHGMDTSGKINPDSHSPHLPELMDSPFLKSPLISSRLRSLLVKTKKYASRPTTIQVKNGSAYTEKTLLNFEKDLSRGELLFIFLPFVSQLCDKHKADLLFFYYLSFIVSALHAPILPDTKPQPALEQSA